MALETTFTDIELGDVLNVAARMKADGQRAVQVMCVNAEEGIDITYSYSKGNVVSNYRVRGVTQNDSVPSIQSLFLGVFPFENEAADLFGVHVDGMVLDFAGRFYELSQKAPMTVISPAQKAAREKARKQAAAKAARAAKAAAPAAGAAPAATEPAPAAAGAPSTAGDRPAAPAPDDRPSAASGWKGKSSERIEVMIAERGLDEATAQRVREGVAKHAARPASAPAAEAAPAPASAPAEHAAPASDATSAAAGDAGTGVETLTYNEPILPASVEVPSTDAVLEQFIDRMPAEAAQRVRAAVADKEQRDGRPLGSQFDVPAPEPNLSAAPKKVSVQVEATPESKPRVPAGVARPSTREVIEEHLAHMDPGRAQAVRAAISAKEERDGAPYGRDGFPPAEDQQEATTGKDGE